VSAPELRIDQLTGLRTILAPGRADRPEGFVPPERPEAVVAACPLCEGQEARTPPEIFAVRPQGGEANGPGWTVRVVPNLYPALAPGGDSREAGGFTSEADPLRRSARGAEQDLFAGQPAQGAHEVIVHTPAHLTSLADLDPTAFAGAIAVWRERMRAHPDAAYVHLIVNEGPDAGASLEHTHAQLYALPFVPAEVARERERTGAYHERTMGGSLLTDVAAEEVRRRERLVAIDDEALLVTPWASRSPFELRVIPRLSAPRFEEDGNVGTDMIRRAVGALADRFGGPPQLNLWVRTAPADAEQFHWHVDIAPRLTVRAAFEMGTGVEINVYPPERAAADLRDCVPD
jgi:UDPglucose--hexose-1-phosphate uridylyltransferase